MPETELSVTEVLADLTARGFAANFRVVGAPAAVRGG